MLFFKKILLSSIILLTTSCAEYYNANSVYNLFANDKACVGSVPDIISGLTKTNNEYLLEKALHNSGEGGMCDAKSFVVNIPIKVYRAYDESKTAPQYGNWWTMNMPTESRDSFRVKNAICKEWSSLNRLISCYVKISTELIIGTTQSASCKDGNNFPKTSELQVYIPNDRSKEIINVENCKEEDVWP